MIDSRLVSVIVVLAVALRISLNANSMATPTVLPAIRAPLVLTKLQKHGVASIQYQEFDPTAVVAVRPGPDRLPGVAGADDNRNGVIDDRLELGATRSDDRCSVLTREQLDATSKDDLLVLQRGAFVSVNKADLDHQRPARAIVLGNSDDGRPWSVLVDLTDN